MSGNLAAQPQATNGAEQLRQAMWSETVTVVRARLARIERGEAAAPPSVVRCLRVLVAPEVQR